MDIENKDLSDKYLELIGKGKLYPPLNGYSAFIQGSEYNTERYFKGWYENKVRFDLFLYMKDGYSQVWFSESYLEFASGYVFHEYLNDLKLFERREKYLLESTKKIDKIYNEYTYERISNTDWKNLFFLVNEIRDTLWSVNASVIFTIILDKQLFIDFLKREKYFITDKELDILWEKAVEPAFESFDKVQLTHLLKLIKDNKNWDEIVEECQYFLTDYYSAVTLSEVDKKLINRYSDYINNPKVATEALEIENKQVESTIKNYEKWMESLPEKQRVLAYYLQTVMRVRDRRKNFFAKGLTIIYRIAEKMFTELNIDRDLIPFYTVKELLKGKEYLEKNIGNLKDRKKGFQWLVPYVAEPKGLNIDVDFGAEKINKHFKESYSSNSKGNTIKGSSAYKGVVTGKVHIVLNVNSNHGFKEGEILVTGMTRPEYVPLMKKAASIITDEGGITCHAAIIARELKKPCITGTKIATKVLKDGDLVEVDADNGVVRIIK